VIDSAPYDVVLYGATGFTGSQAAEYFDDRVGSQLRWAIAGRKDGNFATPMSALSIRAPTQRQSA